MKKQNWVLCVWVSKLWLSYKTKLVSICVSKDSEIQEKMQNTWKHEWCRREMFQWILIIYCLYYYGKRVRTNFVNSLLLFKRGSSESYRVKIVESHYNNLYELCCWVSQRNSKLYKSLKTYLVCPINNGPSPD